MGDAWPSDDADLEDEDRWLHVWPIGLRPAYLDMIDFITTRLEPGLVTRLVVAVDGRGAFRRFKDVLVERPDDRAD